MHELFSKRITRAKLLEFSAGQALLTNSDNRSSTRL